jgi:hypothetical protein
MKAAFTRLMTLGSLALTLTAGASAQCSLISDGTSSTSGSGFSTWTPTYSTGSTSGFNPGACSLIQATPYGVDEGVYNPTVPQTYSYSGYGTVDYMGNTIHETMAGQFYNLPSGYDFWQDDTGMLYQAERNTHMDPNTYQMLTPLAY